MISDLPARVEILQVDQLRAYDADEVAKAIGVSKRTLRDLIVRNLFPPADIRIGTKIRRWTAQQLARGVEQLREESN